MEHGVQHRPVHVSWRAREEEEVGTDQRHALHLGRRRCAYLLLGLVSSIRCWRPSPGSPSCQRLTLRCCGKALLRHQEATRRPGPTSIQGFIPPVKAAATADHQARRRATGQRLIASASAPLPAASPRSATAGVLPASCRRPSSTCWPRPRRRAPRRRESSSARARWRSPRRASRESCCQRPCTRPWEPSQATSRFARARRWSTPPTPSAARSSSAPTSTPSRPPSSRRFWASCKTP